MVKLLDVNEENADATRWSLLAPRRESNRVELAVVGAGPKAAAIVAKAAVVRSLGISDIAVTVFEPWGIGSSWTGASGYTDGATTLGTRPEKDVGYPYACSLTSDPALNDQIDRRMTRYSWPAFLREAEEYSGWVDSGSPAPCHRDFARYLGWVFSKSGTRIQRDIVTCIDMLGEQISSERMLVECQSSNPLGMRDQGIEAAVFNGLVLTGTGTPRGDEYVVGAHGSSDLTTDARQYWLRRDDYHVRAQAGRTLVVGGGESAGSVVLDLLNAGVAPNRLVVLNRAGCFRARLESLSINQIYSHPDAVWRLRSIDDRARFIAATDRGVVSQGVLASIKRIGCPGAIAGRLVEVRVDDHGIEAVIRGRHGSEMIHTFDQAVLAMGFDPWASYDNIASTRLRTSGPNDRHWRDVRFDSALRMPVPGSDESTHINIHVPGLAGFSQSPGFANLSCLGALADRIIGRYLDSSVDADPSAVHSGGFQRFGNRANRWPPAS